MYMQILKFISRKYLNTGKNLLFSNFKIASSGFWNVIHVCSFVFMHQYFSRGMNHSKFEKMVFGG